MAFLTDGIFIKKTKNSQPYLTPLGIFLFGKNKGRYSEFVTAKKGTLIKITDIIIGSLYLVSIVWIILMIKY